MKTYYPAISKKQKYPIGTLCEFCANAIPDAKGHGCSWSRDFVPVDGWIATPVLRPIGPKTMQTYCVHECPQLIEEPERTESPDALAEDVAV